MEVVVLEETLKIISSCVALFEVHIHVACQYYLRMFVFSDDFMKLVNFLLVFLEGVLSSAWEIGVDYSYIAYVDNYSSDRSV